MNNEQATTDATKNKALEYSMTKGFSVIPVGNDKRPLINWREFQDRIADPDEIEGWFEKFPHAGIGIVTGKISNITVVDIDVKEEPHMTPGDFPETYTVTTPSGGAHLYYDYTPDVKTVARGYDDLPGVDIRNEGGYVVAPPTAGYEITQAKKWANFPIEQFKGGKKNTSAAGSFSLSANVGVGSGGRNDSITKVIGSMLATVPEGLWIEQVWPVIVKINATYQPPLSNDELKRTFESIATKEKAGRANVEEAKKAIESPFQISDLEAIKMKLRGSKAGHYKDVTNAVFAFASHSDWCDAFKYDTFQKQITFRGRELKDEDVVTAQMWLQRDLDLHGIARKTVEDAINRRAHDCEHNSVVDKLKSLEWDGTPRLDEWIPTVYGVESDEYHRAIGSNWLRAMVQRLVWPGTKYDHVLVIQGGQGVRKTTSFSVLGSALGIGSLHVETTIRADSKDFLMQFDGRAIVEFSEGETLNRSETKALKAIITRTHDKYRAPYARSDEEHPRQCVFCMTTNDTEYLKDDTGNRRWLIVKMPEDKNADIEWLEKNGEQLFAEAYERRKEPTWIYPEDVAREWQEQSRVADSIEDDVIAMYQSMKPEYRAEGISVRDVYEYIYRNIPEDRRSPVIDRPFEWRAKSVLKGVLKLEYTQRRIGEEGKRVRKWFPTIETDRACPYVKPELLDFEE